MSLRASMIMNIHRRVMDPEPVKNPIRVGVIGLGARSVQNVINRSVTQYEEYRLVAVCDILPKVARHITRYVNKRWHLKVRGYTDFRKMIKAEDLDAVVVQVDPNIQVPICCEALKAGLHVMTEVPLTYQLGDCWRLVAAAEKSKKLFLLMEQGRYAGYVSAWRKIVQSGMIGKPLFAEGEYFHDIPEMFFRDDRGVCYSPDQAKRLKNPAIQPTWRCLQPPIGYLPHELSPLLHVLDDRVVRVAAMSNRKASYKYDNIRHPDTQAALMHTEKDVLMRMAAGFSTTGMPRGVPMQCHFQHIKGTEGVLESPRSPDDSFKLWVKGWHLKDPIRIPWTYGRTDASPETAQAGHGGLDYYVFAHFADAILYGEPLDFDVYKAVETAAPAIMAIQSIGQGEVALDVPDFRPGPHRKPGQLPKGIQP